MKREQIILGAMGYYVDVIEYEVIFTESSPVWGYETSFKFVREPVNSDGNLTPGTWSFIPSKTHKLGISPSNIIQAYHYCMDNFGLNFKPFTKPFDE